jgi:hypothetical protein
MAIYHLTVKIGSKDKGHSAKNKCSYISRTDEYAKKSDECAYSASGNMPKWPKTNPQKDPAHYWQAADSYERENGRLFREVEFALPRELTLEQQKALCHAFADKLATLKDGNLPFTFAIHTDKENKNPHCHLMLSERVNDGIPRNASTWFKRANPKDPKKGGAEKTQELNGKKWLEPTRELWATMANDHLKSAHLSAGKTFDLKTQGVDHRSHKKRGLKDLPARHLGSTCARMAEQNKPCPRALRVKNHNAIAKLGKKAFKNGRQVINYIRGHVTEKSANGERIDVEWMEEICRETAKIVREMEEHAARMTDLMYPPSNVLEVVKSLNIQPRPFVLRP